jgi:hypothetical protein
MKNKKAQVTIFIIIGILIIAIILLFFLLRGKVTPTIPTTEESNPKAFLETCLKDKVRDSIEELSLQGGSKNPELYKEFRFINESTVSRKIAYLCYTSNYFVPCNTQRPFLIKHFTEELETLLRPEIRSCFDDLTNSLYKDGYTVNVRDRGQNVSLSGSGVVIKMNKDLTLTKNNQTNKFSYFKIEFASQIQDLLFTADEIATQQSNYCGFNEMRYMISHPKLSIPPPITLGDGTKIYSLQHRKTKERFKFAIRGCVNS